MQEIESQVFALQTAIDDTLWDVLEDFSASDNVRESANSILKERLNDKLTDAVQKFQSGTFKFIDLIDRLEIAVSAIGGGQADQVLRQKLESLLRQAREVRREFHDEEGMRTTYTSYEEAAEILSDEKAEPPSGKPKPITAAEMRLPRLISPVPKTSRNYTDIADEYVRFFGGADYISLEKEKSAEDYARKLIHYKKQYEDVVSGSKIPWWFVGLTHMMECSFNFETHLHNGDPLSRKTFRVPAGRPLKGAAPYKWADSARDALERMKLFSETDWSLPRVLYRLEQYNGFGYRRRGTASPYLWSFSTIYSKGKFVADGVFSATAVSKQCGAATVLKFLHQKGYVDLDVDFFGEDEDVFSKTFESDTDDAISKKSKVVDPAMPADANFDDFLRTKLPNLRHFQPSEFLIMGGSNAASNLNEPPPQKLWPNVLKLVEVLDELRERLGYPIMMNSVYRSENYNRSVGGAAGSQHKKFCAGDFRVIGFGGPQDWARELRKMRDAGFFEGGIGVYKTFVHVDTRGWPASW